MARRRVFLIEFNEICPVLLERFMAAGGLPNFRRFYEESTVCTTDAEEEPPNLEPWVQWPTVHSGLPFAEHQAFHLGDGRKLERKCVAEVLSDAGMAVGVCGSMNLNYGKLNGYNLPDPWDDGGTAHPEWLQSFYRTIARQVQESSGEGTASRWDLMRFGWFLANHGLTAGTAWCVVQQLLSERRDSGVRWRRASLLDRLLYDVFRNLNRRFDVRFASLFCNSTAHYQHYYWRHMDPDQFEQPILAGDHQSYGDAIAFGYRKMDELLGRLLMDYPDAILVLCSALSQQAWTDTTKCTFRPIRFDDLLHFAGVAPSECVIKPVMAEEFHVECSSVQAADAAEARLGDLLVDDEPLLKIERQGRNLFTGCRITNVAGLEKMVQRGNDGATRRFKDLFHMVHTMRSGRHHPEGVLWIRNGEHQVVQEKVPLTSIAPSILTHFDVAVPSHMRGLAIPLAGSGSRRSRTLAPLASTA